MFSCSNGFLKDPRLYNSKKDAGGGITVAPEPDLGLTGGVDPFDNTEEWYNKPNSNGDGTNPSKEDFPASEFDKMSLVGTFFNDKNVPEYAMASGDVWAVKDGAKAEYVHANAPNTKGQGYEISSVSWYQYRGRNPVYAADGNYNTALQKTTNGNPKLKRFYFYRFTGQTLSPALDNFLFAVDTYSKLMFAFAKPTATKSVFGNNVPTAWGPTDAEPFLGTSYQFYMYDPVGYVLKKDDGSGYEVVLYQWFSKNLENGIYQPTLGGLNDKSQGTPLTEVAKKNKDGAGKSPFNNQTVDFFEENMKLLIGNPPFQRREKVGNEYGLVLYKYTFAKENDKMVIRRTAENWNGFETNTPLDAVTYIIGEGISATEGKLTTEDGKELTFSLTDASQTLTITGDGHETEVAVSNFDDPEPSFRQRVRGATYEQGATKYVFSEDGSSVEWTWDGGKETYRWNGSASDTTTTYYGGYKLELSNNDFKIQGATNKVNLVMGYEALRVTAKGATFSETVRGKPFSYRVKNQHGLDRVLMTMEFSADGTTATLYKEDWLGVKEVVGTFAVADTNATSATIDGKAATLNTDTAQYTLTYDGQTYTYGYEDLGPSFLNRVKYDVTYVSDDQKTVYRFSNNGQRLHMTYSGGWLGLGAFDYTYEYQEEVSTGSKQTSRAVYWARNGIAGFGFAGFELSESDMLVKATNTSAASAGFVDWLVVTYDARKDGNTGGLPTEEDFTAFYDSLKGKTFKTRSVENDVAGLDLLTWTFDDNRGGTLKKQVWLSTSETTEATVPQQGIAAISRTQGAYSQKDGDNTTTYHFSYAPDIKTLDVTVAASNGQTTSLTYYENYDDKGPGFIHRVKGKTYKNDTWTYVFDSTGKTMTATKNGSSSGDTYTYQNAEKKESLYEISAAYDGPWTFGSFGTIWGFKLTNEDKTLASSSAAMADTGSILGVSGTFTYQPTTLVE